MLVGRFLLSLFVLIFLVDGLAQACVCAEPPPGAEGRVAKAARDRARAVFLGRLVRVRATGLVFRVERTWKGTLGTEVSIVNPRPDDQRGTSSCDRSFSVGQRYVVFAHGTRDTDMRDEGACSQTRAVVGTDGIIKLLDEIARTDPITSPRAAGARLWRSSSMVRGNGRLWSAFPSDPATIRTVGADVDGLWRPALGSSRRARPATRSPRS
jgi:hypothetical protein